MIIHHSRNIDSLHIKSSTGNNELRCNYLFKSCRCEESVWIWICRCEESVENFSVRKSRIQFNTFSKNLDLVFVLKCEKCIESIFQDPMKKNNDFRPNNIPATIFNLTLNYWTEFGDKKSNFMTQTQVWKLLLRRH